MLAGRNAAQVTSARIGVCNQHCVSQSRSAFFLAVHERRVAARGAIHRDRPGRIWQSEAVVMNPRLLHVAALTSSGIVFKRLPLEIPKIHREIDHSRKWGSGASGQRVKGSALALFLLAAWGAFGSLDDALLHHGVIAGTVGLGGGVVPVHPVGGSLLCLPNVIV